MAFQSTSGLTERGGLWHIDKRFRGARICESTGTSDRRQAEEYLAKRIVELREVRIFGVRKVRTFRAAATKYLEVRQHKRSLERDESDRPWLDTSPSFLIREP